ncbi:MAG: protease modulator HflC [Candidatus Rokubacteria bacterium]|nr:protease modulator HflC [Candidatus Rokubacteria bacterium]
MKRRNVVLLVAVAIVIVAANLIFFVVDETEFAVVTQFGEPVRAITTPGLHWKWPEPIQGVQLFNNRLLVYNPDKIEFLSSDKKNIVVENYVAWRIADPILYLKSLREQSRAETRLADVVASELGTALGRQELSALVTAEPGALRLPQVLDDVTRRSDAQTQKYGMRVVDVRLKLLNFPEKNKVSVFSRMKSERERQARKYRSEGAEEAAKIRAEAERDQKVILSEAYMKAEKLKGEGDALAIKIYADAYGQDPRFYKFLRTLESYQKFIDEKTTLVLPATSELLKYLNEGQGPPAAVPAPRAATAPAGTPDPALPRAVAGQEGKR